jgi:hypothetical protein
VPQKLIGDFLNELTDDEALQQEYRQDQKGVLQRKSGLTQEQQDELLSNDEKRLRKAIQDEYQKAGRGGPLPSMHIA